MIIAPNKDPGDDVDYGLDWTDELGTDGLQTSSWSVSPEGELSITDTAFTSLPQETTVWLSGGVVGRVYRVTNTIISNAGRRMDKTLLIACDQH